MRFPFGPSARSPIVLSGLHVLLVEDDPDGRDLCALVLEQCGASVSSAETAGAALDALERLRFAAIISDIGLPDEDGYSLIAKVRARAPESGGETPAVAITAFADPGTRRRALATGFQALVPKPIDLDELACTIAIVARRVDEGRRLLDELMARTEVQRSALARLEALLDDRERA